VNEKPVLVDETELNQAPGETGAPMRQDFLAGLPFQAGDLLGEIGAATTASAQVAALADGTGAGFQPSATFTRVASLNPLVNSV
jgi:hypothetical protein